MKKLFTFLLLASTAAMAQDNSFKAVHAKNTVNVVIIQDGSDSFTVEGNEKDKAAIKAEIIDHKLIVSNTDKISDEAYVKVHIKQLEEVSVSGAGDVTTEGVITTPQLEIKVTGAGDADLNIAAKSVSARVSGAGDLKLKGTADNFNASISGAGDVRAMELLTKNSFIISTGAGDAKVNVKDTIDAKVSGAGSIIYKGDPAERQVTINGSGSVRQSADGSDEISIDATIESNDTTRIKWKGKKLIIIEDKDSTKAEHKAKSSKPEKNRIWAGFEMGVNGYFNSAGSLKTPANSPYLDLDYTRSYVINFNFIEHSFRLYKNYVMLTTGLGTQFNRYAFSKDYYLVPGVDSLKGITSGIDFKKNLLKTNYLTAPLMIQFNTSQKVKKSFHLAAGVMAGYNFSTFTKMKYEIGSEEFKIIGHDDFHVNPFKLDATVRLGYGKFNIFANYALTPLFDKNVAPELYPFSLGITLLGL